MIQLLVFKNIKFLNFCLVFFLSIWNFKLSHWTGASMWVEMGYKIKCQSRAYPFAFNQNITEKRKTRCIPCVKGIAKNVEYIHLVQNRFSWNSGVCFQRLPPLWYVVESYLTYINFRHIFLNRIINFQLYLSFFCRMKLFWIMTSLYHIEHIIEN